MLGNLFKYEIKALKKMLLPLSISVLLLSLLGSAMLKIYLIINAKPNMDDVFSNMFTVSTMVLFVFCILAIISANFIAIFLILQRYYKNMFTDEGYLTFTLPAKTSSIILSKLFSGVIWTVIVTVCTICSIFIFALFGSSAEFINHDVIKEISYIWNLIKANSRLFDLIFVPITYLIYFLAKAFENILLFYLAITLGNQVAKKHKIFASVGMYFVLSAIVTAIGTTLSILFVFIIGPEYEESYNIMMYGAPLIGIALSCAFGCGYFFVNKYILKNHLNIE